MFWRLISGWMLALVGCLLLPLVSVATLSSTMHDMQFTVTTAPATIAEHTTSVTGIEYVGIASQSMASGHTRAVFGISHFLNAPKSTGSGTYLYQKVRSQGEHLKYGITKNPTTRYTKSQLDGDHLRIVGEGSKKEMLSLERSLHETLPIGPEEGQLFYIQKQIENGLKPPPYGN